MPVVQISCSGHNPQKALISIDRYPTLQSFFQTLPTRFNVKPHLRATLTYVENGQPYDITDDEGWMIALGEMETQAKPVLVWTVPLAGQKRDRDHVPESGETVDVLQQLLAAPGQGSIETTPQQSPASSSTGDLSVVRRRRRSNKNPTIDGSVPPATPVKRQQQQTLLYRRTAKEEGHIVAFEALDKAWQERFYILGDIVQEIFGSRQYLINPLEICCPLCLAIVKLSQICERRLGNLMHTEHHLRKAHSQSPALVVQQAVDVLVARWEERFGPHKMCLTPLTDEVKACLRDVSGGREQQLQTRRQNMSNDPGSSSIPSHSHAHLVNVGPSSALSSQQLQHTQGDLSANSLTHNNGQSAVLSLGAAQSLQSHMSRQV
ncbi:hypothetical protein DFS34DRAFT_686359 [Phlyctochytrium arcticum]|nr:hypothetical protein DFS34DRAFT_686359 [Phlyctochytrium arcticum]